MKTLWQDMLPAQKLNLFNRIIDVGLATSIIIALSDKEDKNKLTVYLEALDKENRMRIWQNLEPLKKVKIFMSETLTKPQFQRIWGKIGQ